jgi:hypothetical protein
MYTRKHHKEDNSVRGSSPGWKDTFAIDDKGGESHQMQRTKAYRDSEMHKTLTPGISDIPIPDEALLWSFRRWH